MAKLTLLHHPDPRLRQLGVVVSAFDQSLKVLAEDMLETMYAEHGIGLAATQINVQKRLFVMDISEDRNTPMILINPIILSQSGNIKLREGCLSVPEVFDYVNRARMVVCRYQDTAGSVQEMEAEELQAVCIQHEIDHLDGKLFIDYLSMMKQERLQKKIEKATRL